MTCNTTQLDTTQLDRYVAYAYTYDSGAERGEWGGEVRWVDRWVGYKSIN